MKTITITAFKDVAGTEVMMDNVSLKVSEMMVQEFVSHVGRAYKRHEAYMGFRDGVCGVSPRQEGNAYSAGYERGTRACENFKASLEDE